MTSERLHTPGPWLVRDRWYIGTPGPGIRTHAEVKCCANVPASDEAQHEANARLIAAAPELLDALMRLVSQDMTYFRGFVCEGLISFAAVKQAREAISKALIHRDVSEPKGGVPA